MNCAGLYAPTVEKDLAQAVNAWIRVSGRYSLPRSLRNCAHIYTLVLGWFGLQVHYESVVDEDLKSLLNRLAACTLESPTIKRSSRKVYSLTQRRLKRRYKRSQSLHEDSEGPMTGQMVVQSNLR